MEGRQNGHLKSKLEHELLEESEMDPIGEAIGVAG